MTLKFNRVLEVVEIHVRAKFHEANKKRRKQKLVRNSSNQQQYRCASSQLKTSKVMRTADDHTVCINVSGIGTTYFSTLYT